MTSTEVQDEYNTVEVRQAIANQYHIQADSIQDIYPPTPFQRNLFTLNPGKFNAYMLNAILEISPDVELENFKRQWEHLVSDSDILRTQFAQHPHHGLLQIVLRQIIRWEEPEDLESYLKDEKRRPIGLGTPLAYHALLPAKSGEPSRFVWSIHHALFDGSSLQQLTTRLSHLITTKDSQYDSVPFKSFVHYVQERDTLAAEKYWRNALQGCESTKFPPSTVCTPNPDDFRRLQRNLAPLSWSSQPWTRSTLVHGAWAAIIGRFTNTDKVGFGTITSGRRSLPIELKQADGPTISTIPLSLPVDQTCRLRPFLANIQNQAQERSEYEYLDVSRIAAIDDSTLRACQFNTMIVIQPTENDLTCDTAVGKWQTSSKDLLATTYSLTISVVLADDKTTIIADYDSNRVEEWILESLIDQLYYTIERIIMVGDDKQQHSTTIRDVLPQFSELIWSWNKQVPVATNRLVHELVEDHVRSRPHALAIDAWDGRLSYGELDNLANCFAYQLAGMSIGPGSIVPLCFEKSMWTTVAVLAVLKAGAAFALLEPSHPETRLASIISKMCADVILCSKSNKQLASRICRRALVVTLDSKPPNSASTSSSPLPRPSPLSPAYVVFTSGSTGEPKGVVVSHRAHATALQHQAEQLGFDTKSRAYDFASYAFDLAIISLFNTLSRGGCLCVPSDHDRKSNLEGSISSFKVNHLQLTPSVLDTVADLETTGVKTLLVGGEALQQRHLDRVAPSVRLINMYGPSECTPLSLFHPIDASTGPRIGRGCGAVAWVADPEDHNLLAPLGAIGELLLEGPLLGTGYLNDPERTATVFIDNPPWLLEGSRTVMGRQGRLYKTGDLVRYNSDGTLSYMGRKDTQVKIRGQRVELGEVEHHVRTRISKAAAAQQIVAEVVTPTGGSPQLAIFMSGGGNKEASACILSVSSDEEDLLAELLPSYMMPTVYFELAELPITSSGKTDRKRLQEIGASFTTQQLANLSSQGKNKRKPSTKTEVQLQDLWARILGLETTTIGADDSFFRLGGDSISAMKLVSHARLEQLSFSVADIFENPRLCALANRVAHTTTNIDSIEPFALLHNQDGASISEDIAKRYDISADEIEDIYPATPLQQGMLALTLRRAGDYTIQTVLDLHPAINIEQFQHALSQAVNLTPALRTRIVEHDSLGLLQTVLSRVDMQWTEAEDLDKYLQADGKMGFQLGQPLTRYGLVREPFGQLHFVWTLHHALYDGVALPLLQDLVARLYNGEESSDCTDNRHFIRHVETAQSDVAIDYWQQQLAGGEYEPFPSLPPSVQEPEPESLLETRCTIPGEQSDFTLATLIRAAWGLVLHSRTGNKDVVFGAVVSGRQSLVPGIETMAIATIATVPIRLSISQGTLREYLQDVQTQATEMIPFEQTGLQHISAINQETKAACAFQTLLVIQSPEEVYKSSLGDWHQITRVEAFASYSLTIVCTPSDDGVRIQAVFDHRVLSEWDVQNVFHQFSSLLQTLASAREEQLVHEVELLSQQDLDTLREWNRHSPAAIDRCIHELFEEQVESQPSTVAIDAWDGSFTYGELNALANGLAANLGDVKGRIVPLLFEKTKWTTVAMLAVLKAGGAFCMMEPTHPQPRLASIVKQIRAPLMLTSIPNEELANNLASEVIIVGDATIPAATPVGYAINSSSTAYIVFTSGSTGVPKGVIIPHSALSASIHHQAKVIGLVPGAKVSNFAPSVFDAFIFETLGTICSGATLCVPSEAEKRNDPTGCIVRMQPTVAFLPPSFVRLLDPAEVPIKTLIVGGEACTVSEVERWWPTSKVINGYGPSEVTPVSVINHEATDAQSAVRIGKGVGAVTWVVDPQDHQKLSPLGTIGELVLEGPTVGNGYLDEPDKTAAVFLEDPSWLQEVGRSGRVYVTGDLVKYSQDGCLSYIGRKDTQVKIRGQRIELGEIEHHVNVCVPEAKDAANLAVEVVTPSGEGAQPTLAVFLSNVNQEEEVQVLVVSSEVEDELAKHLPSYMMPSVYFTLSPFPSTATGKSDRKKLRQIAGSFSTQELAELSSQGEKRPPSTENEQRLQGLWSDILNIDPDKIGADDSFFRLGGDSITAMRLVGKARQENLAFTVADIFEHPKLSALAASLSTALASVKTVDPFILLGEVVVEEVQQRVAESCGIAAEEIEDIYPATPLQQGLLAMTSKNSSSYTMQTVLELFPQADIDKFRTAWERALNDVPILRTRLVTDELGMLQVVVRKPIKWNTAQSIENYLTKDKEEAFELAQPLARFAFSKSKADPWFAMSLHHAVYDGVTLPLILQYVTQLYQETTVPPPVDIRPFMEYLLTHTDKAAEDYWLSQLTENESVPFPRVPSSVSQIEPNATAEVFCVVPQGLQLDHTISTLVRAAWAIVTSMHTGTHDVVFGTVVSGRNSPVPGIESMIMPTIATVPIRVQVHSDMTIAAYLDRIKKQAMDMISHEQLGIQNIAKLSADTQRACDFQTLLVVQPKQQPDTSSLGTWQEHGMAQAFSSYALTIECQPEEVGISIHATFDDKVIPGWQIQSILNHFRCVLDELIVADGQQKVQNVKVLSSSDYETLWKWNDQVPASIECCVHEIFEKMARAQPQATAVHAWDGSLTYQELDEKATQLATTLLNRRVNGIVPLLFEKTMWTTIAVLAVLKAGAAFVMLEPTHPESRLASIVEQTAAQVIISSPRQVELAVRLCRNTITVGPGQSFANKQDTLPAVSPDSTLYINFTSGSTGNPKGVIVPHQAFASAIHHQTELLGLQPDARVLNYASNAFDAFMVETLMTICTGGCLCVPSDHDRTENLGSVIEDMKINWALLTPSVAGLLDPRQGSSLQTLMLGGEAVSFHDVKRWSGKVRVGNAFGPSECTPMVVLNTRPTNPEAATRIGKGAGAVTWITDPNDSNQLVPLGAVGELLIEGPLVGKGYLNDSEKTAAAFIDSPSWLAQRDRQGKVYKTGDLARYSADGSLVYMGRKDTQIKIHGQRIELAEVEHQVREHVPVAQAAEQIVAELVTPKGEGANSMLAVFIPNTEETSLRVLPMADAVDVLVGHLPSYMIPSIYFTMPKLPTTVTGKVDRKQLRQAASSFTSLELAELRSEGIEKRLPSTQTEHQLQALWAGVLNMDVDSIGANDSFFRLGGDSIAAMKLVSVARKEYQLNLSVADIFSYPKLSDLAQCTTEYKIKTETISAYSLLGSADTDQARETVAERCNIPHSSIQDIYPSTPLQQGLLAMSSKSAGAYTMQSVLELAPDFDVDRFRHALEKTAQLCPILRTRIVRSDELGLVQVVVDEKIEWQLVADLGKYQKKDAATPMEIGKPLARYALVGLPRPKHFVWSLHHALYDGVSLSLMAQIVANLYKGQETNPVIDIRHFIKHIQQDRDIESFWKTQFANANYVPYPDLPSSVPEPKAQSSMDFACNVSMQKSDFTPAMLARAAWTILNYSRTGNTDIIFGSVVSGRQSPLPGIEAMVVPTIATVPIRQQIQPTQSVHSLLEDIKAQATDMITYEQSGIQNIMKMASDAQKACQFQTLLVVQPREELIGDAALGTWKPAQGTQTGAFATYALTLECMPTEEGFQLHATYDDRVVPDWEMEKILQQFSYIMRQLATQEDKQLQVQDLAAPTPDDFERIWNWNQTIPAAARSSIVELVQTQAQARPHATAVHAWNGKLSYSELDQQASLLATHIKHTYGIGSGSVVPLCFEKSMWTTVAALAVAKTGAAFTLMDPSHPLHRRQVIVQKTKAQIVLSSEKADDIGVEIVQVGLETFKTLQAQGGRSENYTIDPVGAFYIAFTSGSTGEPKGVTISHQAFSTALMHQAKACGWHEDARLFDFTSYAFDIAISNMFFTLASGGCVCVPSDDERHDIVGGIKKFRANIMHMTPSVLDTITSLEDTGLETLMLGGEAVLSGHLRKVPRSIHAINTFGPAEATPTSLFNDSVGKSTASKIGRGSGLVTWIVDSEDHDRLAPIGAVGELLLEGPLLGNGYIGEPDKTAAVFLTDPLFLAKGSSSVPGRCGNVYKTGDLVQYDQDGTILYVGRKDTQAKIRGQRIELGEVEHHALDCMSSEERIVAEIISPSDGQPTLALFLPPRGEQETIQVESLSRDAENQLGDRLPHYMIPSVCFRTALPLTATGKTDRKRLREMAASFTAQQLATLVTTDKPKKMPNSDVERLLQAIWAKTLNLEADTIDVEASFFRLGGDSITAMQIASACRSSDIAISTKDILELKTISRIARAATTTRSVSSIVKPQEEGVVFGLTPIQQLHLSSQAHSGAGFDQSFLLELSTHVPYKMLKESLEILVNRHPMLRAQFIQEEDGAWNQNISLKVEEALQVQHIEHDMDVAAVISKSRAQLDIRHGPLTSAVLFSTTERQLLSISIHHLVMDLVSWRILLGELETLLQQQPLPPAPAISFQSWQVAQADYIQQHASSSAAALPEPMLEFWGKASGHEVTKQFTLDKDTTAALMGPCNDPLRTKPLDIFIASLLHSFGAIFSDRTLPPIFNETHGREVWDSQIDLSSTLGWFTSMFPVQVGNASPDFLTMLKETKDCIRGFSHNGWLYFASQLAADRETGSNFLRSFPNEITFNYAGQYQQLESSDALFKSIEMPSNSQPTVPNSTSLSLFDIAIAVTHGNVNVTFRYNTGFQRQQQILDWIHLYRETLQDAASLLRSADQKWTLSDFPLAFDSFEDMNELFETTLPRLGIEGSAIEDVYPCSPMQEGILTSQAKDGGMYQTSTIFEFTEVAVGPVDVDIEKLKQAWAQVVQRHQLLRALLITSLPGSSRSLNVILKTAKPSISVFAHSGNCDSVDIELFRHHFAPTWGEADLQHHLTICQLSNGKVFACLDISHALIDAHTSRLIQRDLATAYQSELSYGAPYKDVISYLEAQSPDEATRYWAKCLEGAEPCFFPRLSLRSKAECSVPVIAEIDLEAKSLHDFARQHDITISTIVQTAWALVLRRYTGIEAPSFGVLASGRDLPIDQVGEIVGPLINILTTHVRFGAEQTAHEALEAVQEQSVSSRRYQTFPLASVHRVLQLKFTALFNTTMSIQRFGEASEVSKEGLQVTTKDGRDPTEVSNQPFSALSYHTNESQYDISIAAGFNEHRLGVEMTFSSEYFTVQQGSVIAKSFEKAILALVEHSNKAIGQIDITSDEERECIWNWNREVPAASELCVHLIIEQQAQKRPDSTAVSAWDGELSYYQLDEFASRLAHYLINSGIQSGDMIPLIFEKSIWTSVAILAVLKAGAAFVLLDPAQPEARLTTIVDKIAAKMVIASTLHANLAYRCSKDVFTLGRGLIPACDPAPSRLPEPSYPAYIIFTSGSTGEPKGILISHTALASSIRHQSMVLGFSEESRTFDFSSYAFDISMESYFNTLMNGGCLCVPSDEDRRNNIEGSIRNFQANIMDLTPSLLDTLDVASLPSMSTILVGGEPLRAKQVDKLPDTIRLVNHYGPSEATCSSIANTGSNPLRIGKGVGAVTWIVDPANHNILAPVGAVGELLLEGPLLGNGYLNDEAKTKTSFIADPEFLLKGAKGVPGRKGRMYKTGDLVRYEDNGELSFVGRKDIQVKIRGQRVELGEVEHHVHQTVPQAQSVEQVVAEVISLRDSTHELLAVFIPTGHDNSADLEILSISSQIQNELAEFLPSYMLPSAYFGLKSIPMTVSGKTNRKQLRELASCLTVEDLVQGAGQGDKCMPTTDEERQLQGLYASVLNIDASKIGINDSFFTLGGDSILAMRLASLAKQSSLKLSMADLLKYPRIRDLARSRNQDGESQPKKTPFSMLSVSDVSAFGAHVATKLHISPKRILDVLPLTTFQRNYVIDGIATPPRSCNFYHVSLPSSTPTTLVEEACKEMWKTFDIFRAVFITEGDDYLQVFTDTPCPAISLNQDTDESAEDAFKQPPSVELGQSYTNFFITKRKADIRLTIQLCHAQYDGVSVGNLRDFFLSFIRHEVLPPAPRYMDFLYFAKEKERRNFQHWSSLLKDARPHFTNAVPTDTSAVFSYTSYRRKLNSKPTEASAALFMSTTACAVADVTKSRDVVLGQIAHGRSQLPSSLHNVVGPCHGIFPIRVRFGKDISTSTALQQTRDQLCRNAEFETCVFSDIPTAGADWPQDVDEFDVVLHYQSLGLKPDEPVNSSSDRKDTDETAGKNESMTSNEEFVTIPCRWTRSLYISCYPDDNSWQLEVSGLDVLFSRDYLVNVMDRAEFYLQNKN